jgi:hypothetical protein
MGNYVIGHGETPRTQSLRRNRLRIALIVAAVEGVLLLAGVIPWWLVVLLALGSVTWYVLMRDDSHPELMQLAWIAAFSQLLMLLVPVAAAVITVLAIALLVIFVLIALYALLRDRR